MFPRSICFAPSPRRLRSVIPLFAAFVGLALCAAPPVFGLTVTLRWQDNSTNESGFRVERATGSGTFAQVATTAAGVTSYADSNAAANTTYRYRVRAYNSAGSSSYSNITTITTGSSTGNTAPTISSIADRTIPVNGTTGAIAFTIGDAQTSAANLTLIRNASDTSLVPLSGITFGGSGANRTVTVKPATNKSGWSTIWVKVSDGSLTKYVSFKLTVSNSANTAPTISTISDRTIPVNGTTGAIAFTIGDAQTSASSLTLIKNASNTSLVPLSGITFGGSGASRTVTVKPAANKSGWSTIWVKVSDGSLINYVSFKLTVTSSGTTGSSTSSNTAPTISAISDRTIAVNGTTGTIGFTISDSQTSASNLTLIKGASNTSVVPLGNITFGGSGANRTVTVKPAYNKSGWSTIWVKVSDGQLERYTSFVVNVSANLTSTSIGSTGSAGAMTLQSTSTSSSDTGTWFGYLPLSGDAELTVHVTALNSTAEGTRGGLMFRESVAADAAFTGVHVSGAGRIGMSWRATKGAAVQSVTPLTGAAPQWLRLTRSGNTVFAFTSSDGTNWEFVDMCDVSLPASTLAGTAASDLGGGSANTATFTSFAVD